MPVAGEPDIDAIVVSWNSGPHLGATLGALSPRVRAIVVDNDSRDDSVDVATRFGATVLEMRKNLGFPAAVNRGLDAVTAPFTLLLNPDLVVGPGAIDRCLKCLKGDATIGAVGPATTMPDGQPEPPAARHDRRAWHIVIESLGLVHLSRRFDRQMIHDRSVDRDVDAINGGFMLMRTATLRTLGGLDESAFMYLEDVDLCRRLRDAGYRIRFLSSATAVHDAGASTRQGDSRRRHRVPPSHRLGHRVPAALRPPGRGRTRSLGVHRPLAPRYRGVDGPTGTTTSRSIRARVSVCASCATGMRRRQCDAFSSGASVARMPGWSSTEGDSRPPERLHRRAASLVARADSAPTPPSRTPEFDAPPPHHPPADRGTAIPRGTSSCSTCRPETGPSRSRCRDRVVSRALDRRRLGHLRRGTQWHRKLAPQTRPVAPC